MPALPFLVVLGSWQQRVTGMPPGPHPRNQLDEIGLRHRRATGTRSRNSPTDVEENRAACSGHGRIGIMPDLHEPAISEIVVPHLLFFKPGWRIRRVGDRNEAIVVGTL